MAENGSENEGGTNGAQLVSALKSKELILPAAVGLAGTIAAVKGPDVVRALGGAARSRSEDEAETLGEEAAEGAKKSIANGDGGMLSKVAGKALGGGSGGEKKTRRLPIQRWTDVAVPIDQAYEAWLNFSEFPKFMHRVLNVEQKSDDEVSWEEKIWFSKRRWEGVITDRRKNDRIAWKTKSGTSHRGLVTFHKLDTRLTRVMVDMEFEPQGMLEKMASGLRFVKRAVEADLARFKAQVEMEDAKGFDYRQAGDDESAKQEHGGGGEDRESERGERAQRRNRRRTGARSS